MVFAGNFVALDDACVLHPMPLRDLLVRLALVKLFRARWSDRIHDEWIRSVLAARPDLTRERLERSRDNMDRVLPDARVTGFDGLISGLALPDPDDRHVLAAAIRCQAGVIVTYNLKDFPAARVADFGIEAQHPDQFVTHLIDLNAGAVCAALRAQRRNLMNPPVSAPELLATLRGLGLVMTVASLEPMQELL